MTRSGAAVVLLAALAYLATGISIIQPDEQGVVRRFGKLQAELLSPGFRVTLPWGMARVDRVKPAETKQLSIGMIGPADELRAGSAALRASEFLTGDQNIIHLQATAQYRVSDPKVYVLRSAQAVRVLRCLVEAALAKAVATSGVDYVLTEGREVVQTRVRLGAQRLADHFGLGVTLSSVNIIDASPPLQVADAFLEAQNARSDRAAVINEAQSYRNRLLPRAEGEAQETIDRAVAYRDALIQRALGESDRFVALLAEYRKAKGVTALRLYLEAMEEILPRLKSKLIIDPHEPLDLSILESKE